VRRLLPNDEGRHRDKRPAASGEDTAASGEDDLFPGWHIWRSSAGRWWATRTGTVVRRENLGTGRVMTLDADDEISLREQLAAQTRLDREISD
jgi:hypothetical protein